ncbi:adaptin N terminal region-domain-containing protein, partial [Halteromyces radiatus]|uniref:adaptin N terminal region-domain-containing protein n=1 Tax=Halteromyces radiatus TaxID=101107 RepID=UPI002220352B
DLASPNPLDISVAVNGLSHIVTPDLARDLCQDLVAMLNHSRPYIRKKVVLMLYKVFLKYPEALRLSFPRIKEKLEDADPSVVSAVVGVICELARKNPKSYLSLAPQLFKLLTTSSNNWMLIKIIKLFASLTPLEPRLIKKLLPPLTSLIQTTPAMSLLYECIYTVITGGFLEAAGESSHALASTCAKKLRTFLEDPDQNCKKKEKKNSEQKDIILECIDDEDISIRLRALDLVVGLVNRKNTMDIVQRLVSHLSVPSSEDSPASIHEPSTILDPVYRMDIINRIVFICSQAQYHNITNFEWYISVLVGITHTAGVNVGELLMNQLMDVAVRVKSVREYCVQQMFHLLSDRQFIETCKKRDSNIEVLTAAAWICGEYCNYLEDIPTTLECLLVPMVARLPVKVQSVYVQNIMKIYAFWVTELMHQWNPELQGEFLKVTQVITDKMDMFTKSSDIEVQERACNVKTIFKIIIDTVSGFTSDTDGQPPLILEGLPALFFIYELNPVAPKAQRKVPVPEGLDLDAWINAPLPDLIEDMYSDESSMEGVVNSIVSKSKSKKSKSKRRHSRRRSSENDEEKERRRIARMEAHRNDPYYIMSDKSEQRKHDRLLELEDVDSIPIVQLSLDEESDRPVKHKKTKGGSKKRNHTRIPTPPPPVYAEEEMPENAAISGSEIDEDNTNKKTKKKKAIVPTMTYTRKETHDIFASNDDAISGLHSVDLNTPLGEEEHFPPPQSYLSPEQVREKELIRLKAERKERRAAAAAAAASDSVKKSKKKSSAEKVRLKRKNG